MIRNTLAITNLKAAFSMRPKTTGLFEDMKSKVSPMWLTYHMLDWEDVKQETSNQVCTECGSRLQKTEQLEDEKGGRYEGYVCHQDKRVTWVRVA